MKTKRKAAPTGNDLLNTQSKNTKFFDIVCDTDTGNWFLAVANIPVEPVVFGYFYFRGPYPEAEARRLLAIINNNPLLFEKYLPR